MTEKTPFHLFDSSVRDGQSVIVDGHIVLSMNEIVQTLNNQEMEIQILHSTLNGQEERINELEHINEWLDKQNGKMNNHLNRLLEAQAIDKPFLKIVDDYFIKYGDDETLFNLHKPSDIRSLIYNLNRANGYSELECEYNRLED